MTNMPAHVYAFIIGAIGLVGIIVLSATSHPVPTVLSTITIAAVTGGAGLAYPSTSGSSSSPTFKPGP